MLGPEIKDRWFPPEQDVTVHRVCAEPGIAREDYLRVTGNRVEGTPAERWRTGLVLTVSLTATGYKGKDIDIRGSGFDAVTGTELRELVPLVWGRLLRPGANVTTADRDIWVPQPSQPGRYRLEAEVQIPVRRQGLARRDGPVFEVTEQGVARVAKRCEGKAR